MLKRGLQIIAGIAATLVGMVVLLLLIFYLLFIKTPDARAYASFSDVPIGKWISIALSTLTGCSDVSDYKIYARRGESDNLIVFFAGGGACWDAETCSKPIGFPSFSGYYFPNVWETLHTFLGGIFQLDNPNNPFHDWNVVYVPYCTADFDIGAANPTYTLADGKTVSIAHRGRQNVSEALDWVYATFAHPPKMLVAGESAGAFASILWTPTLAAHYRDGEIYQLADGAYLKTPRWPQIVDQVWNADSAHTLGFDVGDDIADNAYLHYTENPPANVTYMHINTLYDGTLMYFNAKLNNISQDNGYAEQWSQSMRAAMKQVANSGLKYAYYLTNYGRAADGTTPHTSTSGDLFYKITQDGIFLHDWVNRIVFDGEYFSVGSEFMNRS
ncbi:MAG: pectin acetylesterase-family hydrolase [Chloroflexota bacterium]